MTNPTWLAGADISYVQQVTPNLKPYSVVICRASWAQGSDSRYTANAAACIEEADSRPDFAWGVYAFLMPSQWFGSPEAQVDAFLHYSTTRARKPPMLWFLDWEKDEALPYPRPPLVELERALKHLVDAVPKGTDGIYASNGAPYPLLGQSIKWNAYYLPTEPPQAWDGWQYSGVGLDRSWWKPGILAAAGLAQGGYVVPRFINASGYAPGPRNGVTLPTMNVPGETVIRDLAGNAWAKVGPTSLYTEGLADGHSGSRLVLVKTARYFTDGLMRFVWQLADVPSDTPVLTPPPVVSSLSKLAFGQVPELNDTPVLGDATTPTGT